MNTILLGVIRSELERRNAPAVRALQSRLGVDSNPAETHPRLLRRFRNHVGEVVRAAKFALAVTQLRGKKFVLPGSGHKVDEVRAELMEAGVPSAEIEYLPNISTRDRKAKRLLLFWYWLAFAAGSRLSLVVKLSNRSKCYTNVIFQYGIIRHALRKGSKNAYWCVIGDLSPTLIALAGAVKAEGRKLLSWQYGYQDFKHFPVRPDVAVVLNATGIKLARVGGSGCSVPVLQRKTIEPKPVKFEEAFSGIVGIVLNAFSREDVLSTIQAIARHLNCALVVRPHPRDNEARQTISVHNVQLSLTGSLDEFCSSVDWVICGNTTSALKMRAMGFPVCQYYGFDYFFTDHFEYRAMQILPGFESISDLSRSAVISFYQGNDNDAVLSQMLGRVGMDEVGELSDVAKLQESAER